MWFFLSRGTPRDLWILHVEVDELTNDGSVHLVGHGSKWLSSLKWIYWKINMAPNSINKNWHMTHEFRELAWHQNAAKGDSICWTQTPRTVKLAFEVDQMSIPQQRIRKAFRKGSQLHSYTVHFVHFFPSPRTGFLFFIELHFPFWKTERLLKFHCESAIPSHWAKLVLWVWDAHTETDRVSLEIGWGHVGCCFVAFGDRFESNGISGKNNWKSVLLFAEEGHKCSTTHAWLRDCQRGWRAVKDRCYQGHHLESSALQVLDVSHIRCLVAFPILLLR